jgi:hypothetical protein
MLTALTCESCARRLATIDAKVLRPAPHVTIVTRPGDAPGVVIATMTCPCSCTRPWRLGPGYSYETKTAGAGRR